MRTPLSFALAIVMGLLFIAPTVARAEEHPAYLHALSDLRDARAHLERPGGYHGKSKWDEKKAIGEIDAAIREIKKAAIDDGKDIGEHPAIDAGLEWGGRLKHALELLRAARADIEKRETNDVAKGLKRRAFEHIDNAINDVEKARRDL
jgi:hypothetical protein